MLLNYKDNILQGVRRLRKERRWTQVQFAKLLGLSQSRFSEIEQGKGSFTAEQLLLMLQKFNVSLDYFIRASEKSTLELQNALARLGATEIQEDETLFPSERTSHLILAIRETLISEPSSRLITAAAVALIARASEVSLQNLQVLWNDLSARGFQNRLGWFVENVHCAVKWALDQSLPRSLKINCAKADFKLRMFENFCVPAAQQICNDDILDVNISSERTLNSVRSSRSDISKKWHIVTRIQPENFIEALRTASESY